MEKYNYYKNIVEKELYNYINEHKCSKIRELLEYCLFGGKFIRPVISLLIISEKSITKGEPIPSEIVSNIISIELLHSASLIIDDLPNMDNDSIRRNKLSFHKKYGIELAKVIANKLIINGLKLLMSVNNSEFSSLVLKECKNACIGQYYDIYTNPNFENINLKTSPFFVIAFCLGYVISSKFSEKKSSLETKISLENYLEMGRDFAILFQIADDFEDFDEDLSKNKTMNNVILLGDLVVKDIYNKRKTNFIRNLEKHDLNNDVFNYFINKLDKKIK